MEESPSEGEEEGQIRVRGRSLILAIGVVAVLVTIEALLRSGVTMITDLTKNGIRKFGLRRQLRGVGLLSRPEEMSKETNVDVELQAQKEGVGRKLLDQVLVLGLVLEMLQDQDLEVEGRVVQMRPDHDLAWEGLMVKMSQDHFRALGQVVLSKPDHDRVQGRVPKKLLGLNLAQSPGLSIVLRIKLKDHNLDRGVKLVHSLRSSKEILIYASERENLRDPGLESNG